MSNIVEADCEARLAFGQRPDRFYIAPLGDYGHIWPDKGETYGGTINISNLAKELGHEPTADDFQREEQRAFYREAIDPSEHVLFRLWNHFHPLTSDLWRVYGGIDYTPGYKGRTGSWMLLSIEYRFDVEAAKRQALEALAQQHGAELEDLSFPNDEQEQHGVNFDVLGKSFGEVCALQLRWLDAARNAFGNDMVSVL